MREKGSTHKGKNSSLIPTQDAPELITTCPKCGGEIGLWTGEQETMCIFCGHRIFERETTVH